MQMARLMPALRLVADGVARGDAKSIPLLLQTIDRLDCYSGALEESSPELFRERRRRTSSRRGKPVGTKTSGAGDAPGRSARAVRRMPTATRARA
jgi:hypothetical protein